MATKAKTAVNGQSSLQAWLNSPTGDPPTRMPDHSTLQYCNIPGASMAGPRETAE